MVLVPQLTESPPAACGETNLVGEVQGECTRELVQNEQGNRFKM